MEKRVHIGMSGWSYGDWKGIFYPEKLKSTEWLRFYAQSFGTTEINSSFYHLPRASTVAKWAEMVPKEFRFCPKMSNYLTHIRKLKDPEEPLQRFFEIFAPLRKLLGPVLIQLPPSLKFDIGLISDFLEFLTSHYKSYHFAVEARHNTWLGKEAINLLEQYNIAWVISHSGVGFPYLEQIHSDNIYIRFHGPDKLYMSSYTDEMLQSYAVKIKKWMKEGNHNIWIYFNNTYAGYAIGNARTLEKMIETG